ncbi:morphogenic membrane protein MmpA [Streptomyces sp. 24-1644]
MNTHRTSVRAVPVQHAQRRVAVGMLLGAVAGLVWAGAMLYTVAAWVL